MNAWPLSVVPIHSLVLLTKYLYRETIDADVEFIVALSNEATINSLKHGVTVELTCKYFLVLT